MIGSLGLVDYLDAFFGGSWESALELVFEDIIGGRGSKSYGLTERRLHI